MIKVKRILIVLLSAILFVSCMAFFGCAKTQEPTVINGKDGVNGVDGIDGLNGIAGSDGLSAYEIYLKYHTEYKGTEEEWLTALADGSLAKSYQTNYNIIYNLASVPPVLSSLLAIENGNETYAFIERGKTYSGIADAENFHNIGFDVNQNNQIVIDGKRYDGLDDASRILVENQVKQLNVFGNEKFTFYVSDATALMGLAIAANCGLTTEQFNIVMIEDGTGAYVDFERVYVEGKIATPNNDEIYDNYVEIYNETLEIAGEIFAKKNNTWQDGYFGYNRERAFALASISKYNFSFYLQSRDSLIKILDDNRNGAEYKSKLYEVMGFVSGETDNLDCVASLQFGKIADKYENLDTAQRETYLTLMMGNYREKAVEILNRTTDKAGHEVNSKKLVFIGSRVSGYSTASSAGLTIANNFANATINNTQTLPTYADLKPIYKTDLLFGTEDDYDIFVSAASAITDGQNDVTQAQVAMFNYYINYIFTLKLTQAQYGAEYDILIKGHPRETMESEWSGYSGGGMDLSANMKALVQEFHNSDSIGMKISAELPYGVVAENLAYLGIDFVLGGLNSSTYTGYDTTVPVLFVMNYAEDSQKENKGILFDDNLSSRYEDGTLDATTYINKGVLFTILVKHYSDNSDIRAMFEEKLSAWIIEYGNLSSAEGYEVNNIGVIVPKSN